MYFLTRFIIPHCRRWVWRSFVSSMGEAKGRSERKSTRFDNVRIVAAGLLSEATQFFGVSSFSRHGESARNGFEGRHPRRIPHE